MAGRVYHWERFMAFSTLTPTTGGFGILITRQTDSRFPTTTVMRQRLSIQLGVHVGTGHLPPDNWWTQMPIRFTAGFVSDLSSSYIEDPDNPTDDYLGGLLLVPEVTRSVATAGAYDVMFRQEFEFDVHSERRNAPSVLTSPGVNISMWLDDAISGIFDIRNNYSVVLKAFTWAETLWLDPP
jgi:hypothetical protein